ncbi:MAG: hypothetical protein AAF791_04770 [Bacteroidota bacterium]
MLPSPVVPFDLLAPHPPDRRGREPEVNAWIELHNLLAAAESLDDLEPDPIGRIRRQRGVDLAEGYYDERLAFYTRILDWTLEDGDFPEADRQLLTVVAATLHLTSADLEGAHQRAFGTAVDRSLADDCLDVDERLLLYKLQHTLGLDPNLADGAFEVLARERLLVTVARALCDGELSPEEAREVQRAQRNLGVNVPDRVKAMLDRAARTWTLRHGDLPPVPTDLALPEAETGRYVASAQWRRVDLERLHAVYSDPDSRLALDSGETYHLRVPPVAQRGITVAGRIVLTDARIHFDGRGRKPSARALGDLHRVLRFQNGVLVEWKGDRATFITTTEDAAFIRALARLSGPKRGDRPWSARWRPVYASERDRVFRRLRPMHAEPERYRAALPLLRSSGLSPYGSVLLEGSKLVLAGPRGPKRVSIRSLRGAYSRGRLVWVSRRSAHDWLFEFLTEAEAERFVRMLV